MRSTDKYGGSRSFRCNANQSLVILSFRSSTLATEFSNCSRQEYEQTLQKGFGMCLFNLPSVVVEETINRCHVLFAYFDICLSRYLVVLSVEMDSLRQAKDVTVEHPM